MKTLATTSSILIFGALALFGDSEIRAKIGTITGTFKKISPKEYNIKYPTFYMLETEVTNKMYKEYLRSTKRTKDDTDVLEIVQRRKLSGTFSTGDIPYRVHDESTIWRDGEYPSELDNYPVTMVTLSEIENFCQWMSKSNPSLGLFRPPTWSEWMIAAYGFDRNYPWGNKWSHLFLHTSNISELEYSLKPSRNDRTAYYKWLTSIKPRRTRACDVKTYSKWRTPEGLYGMLGNVSEFISEGDPKNQFYFRKGARWMGGDFSTGGITYRTEDNKITPRKSYWGYSHHSTLRLDTLGFRVLLDPTRDTSFYKRKKIFDQKDKSWMINSEPTK